MTAENDKYAHDEDVITAKGSYLRARSAFRYLLSRWLIILVFGILGAGIGLCIAYIVRPTYTGTLNFVLSTASKASNISGLASQLGIDIGSAQNNDVFSGDNIIVLFKSKKMLKSVLFKKPPQSDEVLANIIVRELHWDKAWAKKERTKNLFPFPENGILTPIQDSLLREVYSVLIKKQVNISRTDPKLSIYTLSTTSTNELVACYLTRYLMDATAEFYITTKTSSAKEALQLLQKEADSLRNLLGGTIVQSATETDRTFALNPAMQVQRAPIQKAQVKSTVVATAYGEIIRNVELAKINLQKENPLYQIIDTPELPLVREKISRLIALIVGGIIGGFVTVIYLLTSKLLRSFNT